MTEADVVVRVSARGIRWLDELADSFAVDRAEALRAVLAEATRSPDVVDAATRRLRERAQA